MEMNEIQVNGVDYVRKDLVDKKGVTNTDRLKMVMIRTYSAGVHFGFLNFKKSTLAGIEVELIKARRVWIWAGAASLSQLAMEGTCNPEKCKFTCEVDSITLIAIEIIPMAKIAVQSLRKVKTWKV